MTRSVSTGPAAPAAFGDIRKLEAVTSDEVLALSHNAGVRRYVAGAWEPVDRGLPGGWLEDYGPRARRHLVGDQGRWPRPADGDRWTLVDTTPAPAIAFDPAGGLWVAAPGAVRHLTLGGQSWLIDRVEQPPLMTSSTCLVVEPDGTLRAGEPSYWGRPGQAGGFARPRAGTWE